MGDSLQAVADAICESRDLVLCDKIGGGAFKDSYLVLVSNGEMRTLKVLRKGCSVERTVREIDAMTKCNHSAIAKLYDVSSINDGCGTIGGQVKEGLLGLLRRRTGANMVMQHQRAGLRLVTAFWIMP